MIRLNWFGFSTKNNESPETDWIIFSSPEISCLILIGNNLKEGTLTLPHMFVTIP